MHTLGLADFDITKEIVCNDTVISMQKLNLLRSLSVL